MNELMEAGMVPQEISSVRTRYNRRYMPMHRELWVPGPCGVRSANRANSSSGRSVRNACNNDNVVHSWAVSNPSGTSAAVTMLQRRRLDPVRFLGLALCFLLGPRRRARFIQREKDFCWPRRRRRSARRCNICVSTWQVIRDLGLSS